MISPSEMAAALAIGVGGSTHCIAMCGGIASSFGMGAAPRRSGRWVLLLSFHCGRLLSYSVIGAALGGLATLGAGRLDALAILLRIVAGLLLIAMGCYVGNWWRVLTRLEAIGNPVWRRLQPLLKRLLPATTAGSALLLGSLWGWLPCGLVYSALAWAATADHALDAATRMLFFGLGTLPAMVTVSAAADATRRLLLHAGARRISGILLIIYGAWTLVTPLQQLLPTSAAEGHHHHHAPPP